MTALLLCAALSAGPLDPLPEEAVRAALPEAATLTPDLAYREGHDRWRLDLVLPAESEPRPVPVVVLLHGGGLHAGDKRQPSIVAAAADLSAAGYACALANYRLIRDAPLEAIVGDAKTAVRYLRATADEHGLDSDRIGAYGNSAGGHLALMLALCPPGKLEGDGPHRRHAGRVNAVCASAAQADIVLGFRRQTAGQRVPGRLDLSGLRRVSPQAYASRAAPPVLLIHGGADQLVSLAEAESLADALRRKRADVTLEVYPDAGHGVMASHAEQTLPLRRAFFDRVLRGTGPAQDGP